MLILLLSLQMIQGSLSEFQCSLDQATFASCSGSVTYNSLTEGNHRFSVQVRDREGSFTPPISYSWVVDTTDPVVSFSQYPKTLTKDAQPSLTWDFTDSNGISSHRCLLNDDVVPCSRTIFLPADKLSDGPYTLVVEATDVAGNIGSAQRSWTVDTVPPIPVITAQPPSIIGGNTQATFQFNVKNETDIQYRCRLDNQASESCESPKVYSNLSDGDHTFYVSATDGAGNTSSEVSSDVWQVDAKGPEILITKNPPGEVLLNEAIQITIDITDSLGEVASVRCGFEGSLSSCLANEVKDLGSNLSLGEYTFVVEATDTFGNSSRGSISWLVSETYTFNFCEVAQKRKCSSGSTLRRVTVVNWSKYKNDDPSTREKPIYMSCGSPNTPTSIRKLIPVGESDWRSGLASCEYANGEGQDNSPNIHIGDTSLFVLTGGQYIHLLSSDPVINKVVGGESVSFVRLDNTRLQSHLSGFNNCPHYFAYPRWIQTDVPSEDEYPQQLADYPEMGYNPDGYRILHGQCCSGESLECEEEE